MEAKQNPISKFCINYLEKIGNESNFFFSPSSIYLALSMVAAGSGGQTLKEFQNVLSFKNIGEICYHINSLSSQFEHSSQEFSILNANKIYASVSNLTQMYKEFISLYFKSGFQQVSFKDPEALRAYINEQVSDQTKGNVKELLQSGFLNQNTNMILVNALYLKAQWLYQFDAQYTQNMKFYLDPSNLEITVLTKMMMKTEIYNYIKFNGFQYIQIPYKNKEFVMEVFLPDLSLKQLEQSLTLEIMQEALKKSQKTKIKLRFPKFKINGKSENIVNVLQQIGLSQAFLPIADFKSISECEELYIKDLFHSATIQVDEIGTEAAASTAIIISQLSKVKEPPQVICDRPFLFTITHIPSKTIIFLGKLVNPQK
ncbi:proteinase inhibitor I4 serpin (macronuclear) [Tetrahymena thermophila SB210]|uniref:Proteinase inhibitor I4 serpin n=1 Tax=Tetrahymena thermophila (strain SB210) TaxID=312017 RepID=Q22KT6_TETTS|nr:proteinase inhibitor I4 serpin [Tetrahymena thermophila SB210]EAR85713.2 proteinase inhibitor I4 serpin [Tetrahymena thermophila SB210]|eukprot:XP_001033376.2 proteinase inhibitor I4 serpin [Tetrahymena thermophila SB210]